jgi:23S rRNA pseudouridine2605 synthase
VLTLSPVLHQRRANRSVTEYRPESGSSKAWTGGQDEARELRAYDRIREEPCAVANRRVAMARKSTATWRVPSAVQVVRTVVARVDAWRQARNCRRYVAGLPAKAATGSGGRPGAPRGNAAGGAAPAIVVQPAGGKPFGARWRWR